MTGIGSNFILILYMVARGLMEHKRKYILTLFKIAAAAVLSLSLMACGDNGNGEKSAEADTGTTEAYTGTDYSAVVTGGELKNGVVFGDITLGNPDAPVTMIEYASLTCPHCAKFHNNIFPELKEKYIKTGKVKLVYRNFTRDRLDLAVGMITRCFGPDKTFDLMGLYFERQRQWAAGDDAMTQIAAVARNAGISRLDLDACLANSELQNNLLEMLKAGQGAGVNGTPTFFVNGEMYVGEGTVKIFTDMVESKL